MTLSEEITRITSKVKCLLDASDYTSEEKTRALNWLQTFLNGFHFPAVLEAADVRWFDDDNSFEVCWMTRHQDSGMEFDKEGASFVINATDENGKKDGWGFGGWLLEDGEDGIFSLFPDFIDYLEQDVYQYNSSKSPRPELMNEKGEFFINPKSNTIYKSEIIEQS